METRLTALRALLGMEDQSREDLLAFALDATLARILAYLHRSELPEGLETALLQMTAAYWRQAGLGGETPPAGAVTAVKRGDVSTSFAAAGDGDAFGLAGGDGFFGWRTVLDAYRKVRW